MGVDVQKLSLCQCGRNESAVPSKSGEVTDFGFIACNRLWPITICFISLETRHWWSIGNNIGTQHRAASLLFGSTVVFSQILDSLYGAIWRCSCVQAAIIRQWLQIAQNALPNDPSRGCLVSIFTVKINFFKIIPVGCKLHTKNLCTEILAMFDVLYWVNKLLRCATRPTDMEEKRPGLETVNM